MPPEAPASLRAAQDDLFALITGRAPVAGAPARAAEALVAGDARASAAERVHVYQHMYRARVAEALESQLPKLARWLGPDAFAELASDYVADEPSRHPSLRFLGQRLPAWLERNRAAQPWLADLARLEWARADVFDAVDEPLLSLDAVRARAPEAFASLPLKAIAAHRLCTVDHAIGALWDRIDAGETPERADDADERGGESLVVWRQDVSVFHRVVDESERAALELCARGTTFGALCDALLRTRSDEDAAAQAFQWLSTWLTHGLLIAQR